MTIGLPSSFKPTQTASLPSSFKPFKEEKKAPVIGLAPLVKEGAKNVDENATRAISQIPQGLLEFTGPGIAASTFQLLGTGEALSELDELEERLPDLKKKFPQLKFPEKIDREKYLEATQQATGLVPSVSNIAKWVEKETGIPLSPKTPLDKTIRFASNVAAGKPGSPQQMVFNGLKAEAAKEVLMQAGLPEPIAEGLALSYAYHEKTPELNVTKKPTENASAPRNPSNPPSEIDRFKSGLTKSKAVESEKPHLALITPNRQKKALKELDIEASKLTQSSLEKHIPTAKEIQEGKDFNFNPRFEALEKPMQKANPEIDITPISEFLNKTRDKYKGISRELLHDGGKKILRQASSFRQNPSLEGGKLYTIYRINNKKQKGIRDERLLKGKQAEYSDFLADFNRAISESFEKTLPKDSVWMKEFKHLNNEYRNVQNANNTLSQLESVLEARARPSTITKLAEDKRAQKKLEISMGKEGSHEVIQIAKDLKKAKESINNIPTKDLSIWDAAFPLSAFIPGFHVPGALAASKKISEFSQRGYGYYLTTPAKRHAYDDAANAINKGDLSAYKEATKDLK